MRSKELLWQTSGEKVKSILLNWRFPRAQSVLVKQKLSSLASILHVMSGGNQAPHITCRMQFWPDSMRLMASSIMLWGCFSPAGTERLVSVDRERNKAKCRDFLNENQRAQTGPIKLTLTMTLSSQPRQTRSDLVNVLECPGQSPDLTPIKRLWRELKVAIAQTVSIQPGRMWEDLQRRMAANPQIQMCKACLVIPKTTTKGASTKNLKDLKVYVNVMLCNFVICL